MALFPPPPPANRTDRRLHRRTRPTRRSETQLESYDDESGPPIEAIVRYVTARWPDYVGVTYYPWRRLLLVRLQDGQIEQTTVTPAEIERDQR